MNTNQNNNSNPASEAAKSSTAFLGTDTGSQKNITWLTISNGFIVQKVEEKEPGAKSRINKLGNTVWEKHYNYTSGIVKYISVETNKFNQKEIRVSLENGNNLGVLTINWESSYGRCFLEQIFNINLKQPIKFAPWQKVFDNDGEPKKVTKLYLSYASGVAVPFQFPEGTPKIVWLDVRGKKVIDTKSQIDQEDFLDVAISKFISDNNLIYTKSEEPISEFDKEMEKPLTEEEMKELKNLKNLKKINKINKKDISYEYKVEENAREIDDFFNDL